MSKFSTEFSDKDWVAVSRTCDNFAQIKIASMNGKFELEIEAPNELLFQIVSQILIAFGEPCKDEITVRIAKDIVMEKEAEDFAEKEGDRFHKYHQPVTYSPGAFSELFNP